ncbi:MAG: RNase P subunit p30 family protein [Halobacteria archaeon]
MYEFVHHLPESNSSLARMAVTASDAGYGSVVSRNHTDTTGGTDGGSNGVQEIYDEEPALDDVDIYRGIEVRADSVNDLNSQVHSFSGEAEVVMVHGGDAEINVAASQSDDVDVVCHPCMKEEFNHVFIRNCAENDVAVEFNLRPVIRVSGGSRVRSLENIRKMLELVRKYETSFIISCDPFGHLEIRGRREVEAICRSIGFSDDELQMGMEEYPNKLLFG